MLHAPTDQSTDVLVIGGGNAGISLAARLHRKGITDITIVEPKSTHHYRPMLSYVGAGLKTVEQMSRPQQRVMPRGVRWIQERVDALDPAARTATLSSDRLLRYRDVVICAGSTPDWESVPAIASALPGALSQSGVEPAQITTSR